MEKDQKTPGTSVIKTEDILLGKKRRKSKKAEECLKKRAIDLGFSEEEIKVLKRIYKLD